MNLRSVRNRSPFGALWLATAAAVAISGCAVAGKSMSIDSTSRMPWFGLELKGRKKKAEGPAFPSVRLDKHRKSRVDTAGRSMTESVGDLANLTENPSLALPTTERSLDSSVADEPVALDFR